MLFEDTSEKSKNEPTENYIVLARRTRPQSLSDLVGQEVVSSSIEGMLIRKQIPHAFLFTGTRGTGKTSSARILAKSLCCETGITANPCQLCIHCQRITACAHDDILEIDGASNTGVDNIRELREAARFYPNSSRYKVFIIDEVHMLSTGAFNALLKTLEEPPKQVIFILATTELHKVPITIRSRCMIFSFKKIETDVITKHLKKILVKEQISYEDDAITIIAREAKGSLRDSLSLLEQAIAICGGKSISTRETKYGLSVHGEELAFELFSQICQKNPAHALEVLKKVDTLCLDLSSLIENVAQFFRTAILIKSLNNKERVYTLVPLLDEEYNLLMIASSHLSVSGMSEIFKLLSTTVRDLSKTTSPLAWSEIIILDCIHRSDWLSPQDLLSLMNNKFEIKSVNFKTNQEVINPLNSCTINNNPFIDSQSFKKMIDLIGAKNKALAAKLSSVKMVEFHNKRIEFAQTAENKIYLPLNSTDFDLFKSILKEIAFDNSQIIGLPESCLIKLTKVEEIKQSTQSLSKKASDQTNIRELETNFGKYENTPSVLPKSSNLVKQSSSFAEIQQKERDIEHAKKEESFLEKDYVQDLKVMATNIKILSWT